MAFLQKEKCFQSALNGVLMVHTNQVAADSQFSVVDMVSALVFTVQIETMYTYKGPT